MAIGLYTVNFEAMALCFRAKIHEYLEEHEAGALSAFNKAARTAFATFEFCGPRLVRLNVLSQDEFDALSAMRMRRNNFAHQGYNEVMSLTLDDINDDVLLMYRITSKVDRWAVPRVSPREGPQVIRLRISPAFFPGFISQVARQVVAGPLRVRHPESDA